MDIRLIDDDHVTNMLNQFFLEEHFPQTQISAFTDAEVALEELCNHRNMPDCIFLDINMSVMDGWEFMDELKMKTPGLSNIPDIYILSSSVDPADFEKASACGLVKGFISKPLEMEKVTFLNNILS